MAAEFPRGAAIAGLGITEVGKVYGKTANQFAADALRLALDDAGLQLGDLDGLLIADGIGDNAGIFLQRDLNLRGLNLLANVGTWGTAPGVMLEIAAMAIATGQATTVACVMGSAPFKEPGKSAGQSFAAASNRHAGWQGIKDSTGGSPGINLMAMMARRHKNTYGWEDGTLGHVAVAQRAWAQLNPKAQTKGKPMNFDDYLSSRWVAEPFRIFDCCLVSNGGVAIIVTSTERAKDLKQGAVPVLGIAQNNPGYYERRDDNFGLVSGAVVSGPKVFAQAGLTVQDVDVVQFYDCFTYTVMVTLEDYGFCKKGEGAEFVASGALGPGGTLPLNTGGGQLSGYYFTGFTPLSEAVIQARGQGGERQAKKHDVVLATNNGGSLDHHISILLGSAATA